MKKSLFLVSCFAVVLMLNNVSIAQEAPCVESAAPCTCCESVAIPMISVPFNHPGLSINQRDVRRSMRLEGRITQRQMRLEAKLNPPPAPGFPFLPPPGVAVPHHGTPCDAPGYVEPAGVASTSGFVPGTTIQSGRINASIQRHNASAPVINFLSIIRPAPRFVEQPYPAYPVPVQYNKFDASISGVSSN